MDILSKTNATIEQAQAWAKNSGATTIFIALAPLYWELCQKVGVNPAVAYAQFAKESGYGKYSGVLNESYCNPCGLKIPAGGSNTDASAHKRFNFWADGIQAHIDHLALYAGAEGYPKSDTLDPRHFSYLLGKSRTVEGLGGNWAPSLDYGTSIVAMVQKLEGTQVDNTLQEYKNFVENLKTQLEKL